MNTASPAVTRSLVLKGSPDYPPLVFDEDGRRKTWRVQREGNSLVTVWTEEGAPTGRVDQAYGLKDGNSGDELMAELYHRQSSLLAQSAELQGPPEDIKYFNSRLRRLNFHEYDFAVIPVKSGGRWGRALLRGAEAVLYVADGVSTVPLNHPMKDEATMECYVWLDVDTGVKEITLIDFLSSELNYDGVTVLDPPFFMRQDILVRMFSETQPDPAAGEYRFTPSVVAYCTDQGGFDAKLLAFKHTGYSNVLIRRVDLPYHGHEPSASMLCVIP